MKVKKAIILFIGCILVVSFITSIVLSYGFKSSSYPYWSPDGTKISYVSTGKYNLLSTDVWMMDNTDNNNVQLTISSSSTYTFNPWSPDGTKLLYISDSTGSYELWTMNANGSNKKQLTEGAHIENYLGMRGWDASWCSDGMQVAYTSQAIENGDKDADIWIVDIDGTNNTKITDDGKQNLRPRCQPGSENIAYLSNTSGNGGIWIMNKDGSGKVQVEDGLVYDAEWSPDGTKMIYVKIDSKNLSSAIWLMDADGANKKSLTNNSMKFASIRFPQWSPDGTKIVFNSEDNGEYEIWVMNIDATGQVKIGNGLAPQWSPNGDKIAFTEVKDNKFSIAFLSLHEELISVPAKL